MSWRLVQGVAWLRFLSAGTNKAAILHAINHKHLLNIAYLCFSKAGKTSVRDQLSPGVLYAWLNPLIQVLTETFWWSESHSDHSASAATFPRKIFPWTIIPITSVNINPHNLDHLRWEHPSMRLITLMSSHPTDANRKENYFLREGSEDMVRKDAIRVTYSSWIAKSFWDPKAKQLASTHQTMMTHPWGPWK